MGIISSNKSINDVTSIDCQGILNVRIGITAAPDIINNPTDIVLVLDRSLSMQGQPLADMKTGVNTFIDIIASATGGDPNTIGSGSRIGIVSFSTTATQDTALITSVANLKAAAAALTSGGFTNHSAAFTEATALLSTSVNSKVIVMFTDGVTTQGPNAAPFAAAAKAQGITIYCIGLLGSGGIDINALNDWATDPDVTHVAIAPDSSQLEQIFADLAANISVPGATDIVINEAINPDFIIVGTPVATVGTINQLTDTSFQWTIDQLGTISSESALVSFDIQHIAIGGGTKLINQSISYTDDEGNVVSFADPSVYVNCVPEDARIAISKFEDKISVCKASEDITVTLIVSNPGNVPLANVMVYDNIPQRLCYKPGTTARDGGTPIDANPQTGIYVGSLNPGQSSTITFVLNVCNDSCSGISGIELINTASAVGYVNQRTLNAESNPWSVFLKKCRVSNYIEKRFAICDFACYEQGYIYDKNLTFYTGRNVNARYGLVIKYLDQCGELKSKCFEGTVIFGNLPGNFNYSGSKVKFINLKHQSDSCGNIVIRFEAVLCY